MLGDELRGRREQLAHDPAVGEEHDALGVGRGDRIVRDHDDRLADSRAAAAGLGRRVRVERARRLVREVTAGSANSARAIATRWRSPPESWCGRWPIRSPRPTRSTTARMRRAVGPAPREPQRQLDVLRDGQRRQQVVGLEHEADVLAAQQRQSRSPTGRSARARRVDPAAGRRLEPGGDCSSVLFPEPDGPMIAVKLRAANSSVDAVERPHRAAPRGRRSS